MEYTDPKLVTDVKRVLEPASGQTVTGYGSKIPISAMIRYGNRWHRVYVMIWSNSGTAYIVSAGKDLILDLDTQYRIQESRNA